MIGSKVSNGLQNHPNPILLLFLSGSESTVLLKSCLIKGFKPVDFFPLLLACLAWKFKFKWKMLKNKSKIRYLIEFVLLIALIVCAELLPTFLHNTQRAFFCRETSLSYPLRKQTFNTPQLYLIIFIVPSVVVSLLLSDCNLKPDFPVRPFVQSVWKSNKPKQASNSRKPFLSFCQS